MWHLILMDKPLSTRNLVCADNPAANLMGGFKSLTSAYRRCRVCLATNDDVQKKVRFNLDNYVHMYYDEKLSQ